MLHNCPQNRFSKGIELLSINNFTIGNKNLPVLCIIVHRTGFLRSGNKTKIEFQFDFEINLQAFVSANIHLLCWKTTASTPRFEAFCIGAIMSAAGDHHRL